MDTATRVTLCMPSRPSGRSGEARAVAVLATAAPECEGTVIPKHLAETTLF